MKYISKREKILNIIQSQIVPKLISTHEPYDYYKVVSLLQEETGSTLQLIEEILSIFIKNGKLVEERFLTSSVKDRLDYMKTEEERKKAKEEEALKEADLILKGGNSE